MRDKVNEVYEELIVEAELGDKVAAKLLKEFNKRISEEAKKVGKGIQSDRVVQWVQWKICRAWGR